MVFQDEANATYHQTNSWDINVARTANYNTDIANLRSRVATLNATNTTFYRGIIFQVDGNTDFRAFTHAVEAGTGVYSGTNGLANLSTAYGNGTFTFLFDIEDTTGNPPNNAVAPFKPGSTTDRFDRWEYYYLYNVTLALDNLGFDPGNNLGWPKILDD